MTTKRKTLDELRLTIAQHGRIVGTPADQYAHNVVSMTLSIIANRHGHAEANQAIDDFGLEAKGWKKQEADA